MMTYPVPGRSFRRVFRAVSALCLMGCLQTLPAFVHPGILHDQADLDRIKNNIGTAPWAAAYASFSARSTASLSYAMQGPAAVVTRGTSPETNRTKLDNDSQASYDQAMMWYITGNQAYANKAIQILDGWSATLTTLNGQDAQLLAGDDGLPLCNAAEILRYTGAGWSAAGIANFSAMMTNVFYPQISTVGDANWGGSCLKTMISIAVFTDNTTMYDNAVSHYRTSAVASVTKNNLPIGENSESGRDVPHSAGGIWNLVTVAEIAWKQGLDLYSEGNNRLAAACEYWCAYNLNNTVPFQTFGRATDGYVYTTISATSRGTILWAPAEMSYAHYAVRKGLQMPYSLSYRDTLESNVSDRLFFRPTASVPTAPAAPAGVTATAAGNRAIRVSWSAVSGATDYTVMRNVVGANWPYGDVVASGITATTCTDTGLAANTTHYYTVYAHTASARSAPSAQVSAATPTDANWIALSAGNTYAEPPFQADAWYSGGAVGRALAYKVIDLSAVTAPAPMRVYEIERHGNTTYTIPGLVAGAGYQVRLHLAEIYQSAAGTRQFNVAINGTQVLGSYDLYADAGTNYKAVIKSYTATANASGQIVIQFTTVLNNAMINGLEVVADWSNTDIGTVGTAGSGTVSGGVYTVKGSGGDIGGTGDSLHYAYKSLNGDGVIVARFAGETIGGTANDKAGLMIRESTASNAKSVALVLDSSGGTARIATRSSAGGSTAWGGGTAMSVPRWMKLQRAGTTFTSSMSSDGVTWTTVGTSTVTMNTAVLIGFAVCSRDKALNTSLFDSVSAP